MHGIALFRIGLWAFVALCAGAAVSIFYFGSEKGQQEAAYGTPFQLVDQDGAEITEAALRNGKPSAVFFGFTHCPDVCPTTLAELAGYQKALKADGKDLQVVFVSVDPERDTPAVLKSYVEAVSPDIIAITGEPAKIAVMLKGWAVYAKKVGDGPDYSMDHTATTFLLDSAGRFSGTIAYGEDPKTAKEKLDRLAAL
jgi:protein SCO1/2